MFVIGIDQCNRRVVSACLLPPRIAVLRIKYPMLHEFHIDCLDSPTVCSLLQQILQGALIELDSDQTVYLMELLIILESKELIQLLLNLEFCGPCLMWAIPFIACVEMHFSRSTDWQKRILSPLTSLSFSNMTSWQLNSMIECEFSILCPRLAMLPFGSSGMISVTKRSTHIEFSKMFFLSRILAFKRRLSAFLMRMKR
jgi:hypothetical protein